MINKIITPVDTAIVAIKKPVIMFTFYMLILVYIHIVGMFSFFVNETRVQRFLQPIRHKVPTIYRYGQDNLRKQELPVMSVFYLNSFPFSGRI